MTKEEKLKNIIKCGNCVEFRCNADQPDECPLSSYCRIGENWVKRFTERDVLQAAKEELQAIEKLKHLEGL
jgi:hypothetical protein